jgi:hypothetical protein
MKEMRNAYKTEDPSARKRYLISHSFSGGRSQQCIGQRNRKKCHGNFEQPV